MFNEISNKWVGSEKELKALIGKLSLWNLGGKGFYFSIKGPSRSLSQNALMWSLLGQFASQKTIHGNKLSSEQLKVYLMAGWNAESGIAPLLIPCWSGNGLVDLSNSTSNLSVGKMTSFIEYILAAGAQRGVNFRETKNEINDVNGIKEAA